MKLILVIWVGEALVTSIICVYLHENEHHVWAALSLIVGLACSLYIGTRLPTLPELILRYRAWKERRKQ